MTQIADTDGGNLEPSVAQSQNSVVPVEVIELGELTIEEMRERLHLERVIERSFYDAGKALKQLRDHRLYRSTHRTFTEYCSDRFGYGKNNANMKILAASVVDEIQKMTTIGGQILPTTERQVRPLTKLEPDEQREAWQMAVEEAGNKVPSSTIVKDIVQSIRERTKVPNPYKVGEVCQIIPKDNPELKGKSGCWCIVSYAGDCSCTVTTWDSDYVVKLDNLNSFNYLEEECTFMQQLCSRLQKLHSFGNLDTAAYWIMNGIGKLSTPYLTPLQEKLLGVLEQEYRVG